MAERDESGDADDHAELRQLARELLDADAASRRTPGARNTARLAKVQRKLVEVLREPVR